MLAVRGAVHIQVLQPSMGGGHAQGLSISTAYSISARLSFLVLVEERTNLFIAFKELLLGYWG